MQISARNQLRGTIKKIHLGDIMAEVIIDIAGQELVSVITRTSADGMRLQVGDTVLAVIKSTEVMVGKP